jgi:hypothetical protein
LALTLPVGSGIGRAFAGACLLPAACALVLSTRRDGSSFPL